MQYRQIEAFRYVMIYGTTTAAAEVMCVSQPAISRLIGDLEYSIGFKLFDRAGGRLSPTPDGLRFLEAVEQYYSGMDRLATVAKHIRNQLLSDLKISSTPALATFALPRAVRKFQVKYPNVGLVLENMSSSELASRLKLNLTHIGLTLAFPETPGIVQIPIKTASHVCAVHRTHRLAEKNEIRAEDLAGETILKILPTGLTDWSKVASVFEGTKVDYAGGIGIQNSHTGYSLVAENLAVAIIEPFAAASWANNGVVVKRFKPDIIYTCVLAHSSLRNLSPEQSAFIDILTEIFENERET